MTGALNVGLQRRRKSGSRWRSSKQCRCEANEGVSRLNSRDRHDERLQIEGRRRREGGFDIRTIILWTRAVSVSEDQSACSHERMSGRGRGENAAQRSVRPAGHSPPLYSSGAASGLL